jgi:hypothetical protein
VTIIQAMLGVLFLVLVCVLKVTTDLAEIYKQLYELERRINQEVIDG